MNPSFGACAVLLDGTVICGATGDGADAGTANPVGISGATSLSVAPDHACALLSDGSVECWGQNNLGQLGNGETSDAGFVGPVKVKPTW